MTSSTVLFDPSLIPQSVHETLPDTYSIRPLSRDDYSKGFYPCLEALTWTGSTTETQFQAHFDWMQSKGADWYYNVVIEHGSTIVGTGALIIDRKL